MGRRLNRPILFHPPQMIIVCHPNSSMRWTVRNHGLSSDAVHEVDGPWWKICPFVHLKTISLVQRPNLSMRWTVWAQIFVRCPHGRMDGWTVRRRPSSSVEAWSEHHMSFKIQVDSAFEEPAILIIYNLLFEIFTRKFLLYFEWKNVIGLKIFSPSLTIIVHKMIIFHDFLFFENEILPYIPFNNTDS